MNCAVVITTTPSIYLSNNNFVIKEMNKDFKKKHEIFMFKKVVKKNQNNIKKIIKTGCKKKHKIDIESYVMKKRIEKEYGKN